jgi:hypothetical protein
LANTHDSSGWAPSFKGMSSNCPSIVTEFVLQMRQLVVVEKDMRWELQHPCHENYWLRMK